MSAKFFNNESGNTLFHKLQGIASEMVTFRRFWAVSGFFRSSGYFKLRRELGDIPEIKILVGINIDGLFLRHNKALLFTADEKEAHKVYEQDFKQDILEADYSAEVEEGILQMYEDLVSGRLQMRIHATKTLHAKFYLCLPTVYNEHSDGWVIMGSSNISEAGLGITRPPRYELNIAIKEPDDVNYCVQEFEHLWEQGVPLSAEDIEQYRQATYLGDQPTPYELYIKVLIDTFGEQVEDDFTLELPEGYKDLKYQKDAVIQGYQMLLQHDGLFLSDVVGLGKTMIATMIAKRFIEANGRYTRILVVYPPALQRNWEETFTQFGIAKYAQFVSSGSLSKVADGEGLYRDKEDFSLVIVDEAHSFRNDNTGRYDALQRICKSPCSEPGLLGCMSKKVMLLSATPLNNRPSDLLNQLLLFQNSQTCTIDGIPNLRSFFAPYIERYQELMRERDVRDVASEVDELYEELRSRVIDKVTIRRTRTNILNDPDYKADIDAQGIIFPRICAPVDLVYQMDEDTSARFYHTLLQLTDGRSEENPEGTGLYYARYRAVEFLKPDYSRGYQNAEQIARTLAGIYRVHMVKRLESSFYAFKKSLHTLLQITTDMLGMLDADKVIIAPDLKVKDLQEKGWDLDEIIEYAAQKGYDLDAICFPEEAFTSEFREMLEHDKVLLESLVDDWEQETDDPKLDLLVTKMQRDFFASELNPSDKLVLFSESVDTLNYLYRELSQALSREDILVVTSQNRKQYEQTIRENFDANYPGDKGKYQILLTSDVLAEGVNLHRSNVIVNYDSPWNATRLMQRIGRVNRIGSVAPEIHNYMFYPSIQGDREINLYSNALIKLQGFHSAFGEDAQIFSREEIVKEFQLFDSQIQDAIDRRLSLLREVRELYQKNRGLYRKIKELPRKSRVLRHSSEHAGRSVVFVSSNVKTEYYLVEGNGEAKPIDFLEAAQLFYATPEEAGSPIPSDSYHYTHVRRALETYETEHIEAQDTSRVSRQDLDSKATTALAFLRRLKQTFTDNYILCEQCDQLAHSIEEGIYSQLSREINKQAKPYKNDRELLRQAERELSCQIARLAGIYATKTQRERLQEREVTPPCVIISESFA